MVLWIVAGAGKGVGKTRAARALALALGGVPLAKQGHRPARADKPPGLLHGDDEVDRFLAGVAAAPHVVLESNAAALRGLGDAVIFVEGQPVGGERRPDAADLRARAGIVLSPEIPIEAWRAAVAPLVPDPDTRAAVLDALVDALGRSPAPPLRARAKVWLELPGGRGLGRGLVELLEHVDRTGTLRAAARATGMSYRHAWDLVHAAEEGLGIPLVASRPGGLRGGSSGLTAIGQRLLRVHRRLDREVAACAQERLRAYLVGP